ncbi:hypothetical protein PQR63_22330 [Herbaspirillum rhizosphaerae]|uniref:LysR substrate binding domain-containing protein n=1 Tax=Herbaspirillum rhizosphaerae TaxID=346179 RepID=A0ABW8ZDA3_9BURK
MYSIIRQFRSEGIRRTEVEIAADAGFAGIVGMSLAGTTRQMTLSAQKSDEGTSVLLLPPLYEPQLLSMHADGMIVRGWQRLSGSKTTPGPTYLQEWLLTFVGQQSGRPQEMRELQASPLQLMQGD